MNEVILLNKPAGMTSFAAVKKCGRFLHERKAGHTGTLDPNASGLMILLFGRCTKLAPYACSSHKVYEAEFILGEKTDTEDIWGNVIEERQWRYHSQAELDTISASFIGEQEQIPPMYSALKHEGKKLYEYARQGIEIERQPRKVMIYELKTNPVRNNIYHMHACVSGGTYIRTLINDYAQKLGELASMSSLERTAIEHLSLKEAASFDEIEKGGGRISPLAVISPEWKIHQAEKPDKIKNGQALKMDCPDDKLIFVDQKDILAAYERREDGYYHCLRGLQ